MNVCEYVCSWCTAMDWNPIQVVVFPGQAQIHCNPDKDKAITEDV